MTSDSAMTAQCNESDSAMKAQLLTIPTPDGPFTIIARDGVVLASGWTADPQDLTGQIHPQLLPDAYEPVEHLGPISAAVEAFYAGDPAPAMNVPVLQKSGPFRAHAWDVLRTVGRGRRSPTPNMRSCPATPRQSGPPPAPALSTPRRCSFRATA